jgi:hypothetical protein
MLVESFFLCILRTKVLKSTNIMELFSSLYITSWTILQTSIEIGIDEFKLKLIKVIELWSVSFPR